MWEIIEIKDDGSKTSRLRIHGGWLVRTIMAETGNIAMAFVPDPGHLWDYEREEQDPDFRWN